MRVNSPIEFPAKSPSGARWQRARMSDFSGGMVTSVPRNSLKPNQFKTIENLLFNTDGTLRTRDDLRPFRITTPEADLTTTYNPKDFWIGSLGAEMLLVAQDDTANLKLQKAGATSWGAAFGELTSGTRARFVKYTIGEAEELIVCTGADTPARCDGSTLTDLGLTAPNAAAFTLTEAASTAGEGGVSEAGTYYYKFTFFYDTANSTQYGESAPTAAKSIAVGLSGHTVAKIQIAFDKNTGSPTTPYPDIPTGGYINIYRSRPGNASGPFYYIGRLSLTDAYDRVPVGAEGDPLLPNDGVVPEIEIPYIVDGRLVGSDGARKNKLVWSEQGSPDVFPALNFVYFKDNITGIAEFNRDTFVFTENEVYILPESNFENGPVKICDKGCASGETIADVGTGLVWMGKDSVYWANFNVRYADGDFPIPVGRPIENLIKEIAAPHRKEARACYFNKDYYLSVPEKGGSHNTLTLVMNIDLSTALAQSGSFGGWTRTGWAAEAMAEYGGALYSSDRAEKVVYAHQKRAGTDYKAYGDYPESGNGIPIAIESGDIYAAEISSDKLTRSFGIITSASKLGLTAQMAANYDTYSRSISFSADGVVPAESSSWMIWSSDTTYMGRWYGAGATYEIDGLTGDAVAFNGWYSWETNRYQGVNGYIKTYVAEETTYWGIYDSEDVLTYSGPYDDEAETVPPATGWTDMTPTAVGITCTFGWASSGDTWAGDSSNQVDVHRKFSAVKGKNLCYKITSNDALDLNILGFYWTFKELPARI